MSTVVVTGGAGFIASHCAVYLLEAGYKVVAIDNFVNSSPKSLERVEKITGKSVECIEMDIRNYESLKAFFESRKSEIVAVLHCAALKAVGESVQKPILYYENNVNGSLNLLRCMSETGCKRIVFSSSATVYGDPQTVPITEEFPISATNPYGISRKPLVFRVQNL
jgi:UDP-glucose 4-epimerase